MRLSTTPSSSGVRRRLSTRVRHVGGAETVAVRAWLRGGSRSEAHPGQALLAGRMLAEGTRQRGWRRIAEDAEALGMVLGGFGSLEVQGLRLDCLAADWRLGLDWLAEMLLEPSFPPDRFDWVRTQTMAELDSLLDQPEVKAGLCFAEHLYAPHAAGRALQGDPASLASLRVHDCVDLHRAAIEQGLILTVAGSIDADAVTQHIEARFDAFDGQVRSATTVTPPGGLDRERRTIETEARNQAHLLMGHLSVPIDHQDYRPLEALSVILGAGAGLTGRIPTRIREREGLAYSAYASAVAGSGLDRGRFFVSVATSPERLERAESCVREEIERLMGDGVTRGELDDARAYLLGREPFHRETGRQWADLDARSLLYELPIEDPDWLREGLEDLSVGGLNDILGRHLSPSSIKTTIGLPSTVEAGG